MLLLELFTLLVALAALAISIYLWVDKKKNGLHPDVAKALNELDDTIDNIPGMKEQIQDCMQNPSNCSINFPK
jgi:hypothetical protein